MVSLRRSDGKKAEEEDASLNRSKHSTIGNLFSGDDDEIRLEADQAIEKPHHEDESAKTPPQAPHQRHASEAAQPETRKQASEQNRKSKILLVEDNADMRDYLRRLLAQEYEVIPVTDGETAYAAVHVYQPDLVLSNVMMPQLDGYSLIQRLRADPQIDNLPIILLSARTGEEAWGEGLEYGADDYLLTPFSARELLARVHTHLELARVRKTAEEALRRSNEALEARVQERTRELQEANEALRRSEARLQQAISIETVGIIFFNSEGVITEANDAFLRMSGFSREALQAGKLTWQKMTPPEFMPQSLQALEELRIVGESTPYEKQYIRADGSRWWGVFAAKRLDEAEMVEFIVDTTRRKRMEEALRLSEERLRLLIESVQDYAIFTLDPGGRVTSWNEGAYRLSGYRAEEVIGRAIHLFYTPEDLAAKKPEAELQTALKSGRSEDESWRARKDGSRFWANEIITPLRDSYGQLLGFTKISRDLTERKQAEIMLEARVRERTQKLHQANAELQAEIAERLRFEAELHKSEAQLRRMASRLTLAEQEERHRLSQILHDDLQQLLYGIQLTLEFVKDGLQGEEQAGLLQHTEEAITWLHDAVTRTRQITVDLSPPVLRGEGLTDALAWLAPQMAELYGLRVEVEAARPFLVDQEDMRVLLFQIIRELLFNVVKHAGTDRARVTLQEERGHLVIRVSDEGQGFQVEAVEADHEQGFGLFSIRERLGLFGGRLEITSRPGEGTQVTVYTPVEAKKARS